MSRIGEALKRAGTAEPDVAGAARAETFLSAWPIAADETPAAAPPPAREASPAAPSRLEAKRGTFVTFSSAWKERLATSPGADPAFVEQFRRLAAVLHSAQAASGIKVLMVTSASPEDGKTLTALNLALVLGQSYRKRVLLIDADLRRPSLGRATELTAAPGLSDALKSPVDGKLAVARVTPMLTLLPAGRPNPDPISALSSPRMRQILEEASALFDWIILDAPPMGPVADANVLAEMADAAVFVIRAGQTQHAPVKKALDALGRERVLGIVLNAVEALPADAYKLYAADARA